MKADKLLAGIVLAVVASLILANAAVFAYRWVNGNLTAAPVTEGRGAACVGFYSSVAQPNINLPTAGTNYNAPAYGGNSLSITPGDTVCQWTVNGTTYRLYESITVNVPLVVGSWYIKDFYGFGYRGTSGDIPIYVTIVIEDALTDGEFRGSASLEIRRAGSGSLLGDMSLVTLGSTGPFVLQPGEAFILSLKFDVQEPTQNANFRVAFYASHSNERP